MLFSVKKNLLQCCSLVLLLSELGVSKIDLDLVLLLW